MFHRHAMPATMSAYAGLPLTLPSGETCVGQIPTLKESFRFLGLFHRMQNGDPKAAQELIDTFPRAVGLEAELNRLTLPEFWEVVAAFFSPRSPRTPQSEPTDRGGNGRAETASAGST